MSEDGSTAYARDGYIYDDAMPYKELSYGVSTPVCPAGSTKPAYQCTAWEFFDANTGRYIAGWDPWPPRHGHL